MGTGNAYPDSLANGGCNAHKSLKTYNAPQFKILTPEQAAAELGAKDLPEDAGAQQLLRMATQLSRKTGGNAV